MKAFLLIAGFLIACNAVIIGGIGLAMGFPVTKPIDIHRPVGRQPSLEEIRLAALLETAELSRADRPQLIVLGSSVPAEAYPPALVQSKLPGFTASNLAVPATTMTEILQLFDEARWSLSPRVLEDSVLVLAVNWIAFTRDMLQHSSAPASHRAWWEPPALVTYVRKAADRSPPILAIRHPLRALLPRRLVLAGKQRLRVWGRLREILPAHPGEWLAQRRLWRLQTRAMRSARERHEAAFPSPQPILEWFMSVSVEEQTRFMIAQTSKAGPLLEQHHFDNLARLLDGAISAGMTVVIVDLPLHGDHRRHFPALAEYQARLREVVASHAGHDQVHLIDLTEALPDEKFQDLVHAKPDRVEDWVDLLVDRLRPFLPDPSPRRLD
jgi:hypothetical protein